MSQYDDYDGARDRRSRPAAPYPDEDDFGDRRSRAGRSDAPTGSQVGGHKADIPPPPLGSAMKREGSRSRVPSHMRPDFPDEASYLNARSPDAERKNGERDRKFRERRGGYESDEGEQLKDDIRKRRSQRGQPPPYDDDRRRNRDDRSEVTSRGGRDRRDYPDDRRRDYDDRRRPERDYDDRRRRHDDYDDRDTELPSRRRGPRDGVEYGADPIKPTRRSNTDRPARDGRDDRDRRGRNSRYDDDDDDEYKNRRKSLPPRRSDRYDDDDYDRDRDRDRRRRDDDYGRDRDDRRPRRRRSHDDYDDDYDRRDRRDRRDGRDGRDRKEPTQMKFGNVDIGPAIDKGQKYYATVAPILTPLVMNYLKNKK